MKNIYAILFFAFCCASAHAVTCPPEYPNNVQGTDICYLITEPGEYVPTPGAGTAPCPAGDYCPGGDKIYNITIPEQYKPVEYLENNSTAYIDTGHIPTPATTFSADVMITGGIPNQTTYRWMPFIGTRIVPTIAYACGIHIHSGQIAFDYFNDEGVYGPDNSNLLNKRFTAKTQISDNKIYTLANNIIINSKPIVAAPDFPSGIHLFKIAGDNANRNAYGRFYFYQVRESDNLVQYMIPVYDTNSEQYGMYDIAGNTFFPSANDDKFTGGPVIETTSFPDLPTTGGNYSCASDTDNEFISSPPKSTDITDCGKVLHIGNHKLYLRRRKITQPTLIAKLGDTLFYAEMTTEQCGHLRTNMDGTVYSICNLNAD